MMNRYYNPVRTIEGAGSVGRLPELLEELRKLLGEENVKVVDQKAVFPARTRGAG